MELYSHSDPYKGYLHHPTPEVGRPRYLDQPGSTLDEFYRAPSSVKVVKEIQRLFACAFRTQVMFGQRHFAPSASWRDEHVATQANPRCKVESSRFAVRVHIFEERGRGATGAERAGRYLGFVALRPEDPVSGAPAKGTHGAKGTRAVVGYDHVVEAEMVSPAHMQRPRYHLILTNASSARMGVLPFKSAVYMARHRSDKRTSTCMHLAISQALHLVMSRFGCRPISQREFDAHVWKLRCHKYGTAHPKGTDWPLLKHVGAGGGVGDPHGGAQLVEALEVMDACAAGGFTAHFSAANYENKHTAYAEAWRCLTDALANGLPVILMVNHRLLTGTQQPEPPHAQFVFGMRLLHCQNQFHLEEPWEDREDRAELPGEFVGHDVLKGPFFQTKVRDLFDAAWDSTIDLAAKKRMPGINFLVIGPHSLKQDMRVVREAARQYLFSLVTQTTLGAQLLTAYCTAMRQAMRKAHNRTLTQTLKQTKTPAQKRALRQAMKDTLQQAMQQTEAWLELWRQHKTDWRYVTRFQGREEFLSRPDLSTFPLDTLPDWPCLWVVEVWHPHESHGLSANEPPTWPPPVIIWGNASAKPAPHTKSAPQRGVLQWDIQAQAWVAIPLPF